MSKTKQVKKEIVENLKNKLHKVSGVIVTDYKGLNVADLTNLRHRLRKVSCDYHIVKNTLLHLLTKDFDLGGIDGSLKGPTAIAFVYGDPVAPVKIFTDFIKDHENFKIKVGVIEKKLLTEKELKAIANLPTKQVLLQMLVSSLKAPINNLAYVLKASNSKLVWVLEEIKKIKERKM